MLIDERHSEILSLIKEKTFVKIEDLSEQVYASPATIRRDLIDLEKAGLIQRVRGGATIIGNSTGETSSLVRSQTNIMEKRRMAEEAIKFIKTGESYFFDSSTSVGQIIQFLGKVNDVTIITNGLENGMLLSSFPNCSSYIAGGSIQPKVASSTGADSQSFIGGFFCDAFFFSCHGFSVKTGPTEGTIEQQRCKGEMIKKSAKHILLVDHGKFERTYVASVCPLSEINVIITDKTPSDADKKAILEAGVELIVAD